MPTRRFEHPSQTYAQDLVSLPANPFAPNDTDSTPAWNSCSEFFGYNDTKVTIGRVSGLAKPTVAAMRTRTNACVCVYAFVYPKPQTPNPQPSTPKP